MKKRYDKDEWYPVWEFDDTGRWVAEVSEEFVARVKACFAEFDALQDEFRGLDGELVESAPESAKQEER